MARVYVVLGREVVCCGCCEDLLPKVFGEPLDLAHRTPLLVAVTHQLPI